MAGATRERRSDALAVCVEWRVLYGSMREGQPGTATACEGPVAHP